MYNLLETIFGTSYLPHIAIKVVTALAIYVAAVIASKMAEKILGFIARLLFKNKSEKVHNAFKNSFAKPLTNFIKIAGVYFAVTALPLNAIVKVTVVNFMTMVLRIALMLMISISIQNLIGNIPDLVDNKMVSLYYF